MVLFMVAGSALALGFDQPVYTGQVIDGAKYMVQPKLDPTNIGLPLPKQTLDLTPAYDNYFYTYGINIMNLKISPSQVIGGNTVTVSYDVYNNYGSDVYSVDSYAMINSLNVNNANYIGTMAKGETKHVALVISLPLCPNGKDVVKQYDVAAGVYFKQTLAGQLESKEMTKPLTLYNDKTCNAAPVDPVPPVQPQSQDPVVTIKATNENPMVGDIVSFTAEFTQGKSTDFVYNWDFNGDSVKDSSNVFDSYAYAKAGTYTVTLTLKNTANNLKETKFTKQIIVSEKIVPQEQAPEFTILITTGNPKVNTPVTFNVAFTKGNPLDYVYAWDFNGDTIVDPTNLPPTFTYANAGIYTVSLKLTKGTNNYIATKQIIVADAAGNPPAPVNTAPVVDFTSSPANPVVNQVVQFTATASDAEKDVLTYAWDFNKDNNVDATTATPMYTFATAGNFEVSLTVTDGKTSTVVKKTITVTTAAVVPQTDSQKVKDFENQYNKLDDKYGNLKDDYTSALKASDSSELKNVKDDLKNLYNDVKDLENQVIDLYDKENDSNLLDDLKILKKDIKDLKKKVLDLKSGTLDDQILHPTTSSSNLGSTGNSYVPQQPKQVVEPAKQVVDVITTPSIPSANLGAQTPVLESSMDSNVKLALIIAGIIVLLALVIFVVAVIFAKF